MLKHQGRRRTFAHNLRLASLLSAVAGIVNSTGLLALGTLVTNVTGHFAFFSEQFFLHHYQKAWIFLLFIFFFFAGAFCCGILIENLSRRYSYRIASAVPLVIEVVLLTGVAGLGDQLLARGISFITALSCVLLFAMGLQNALVTKVSQSVVRTTHLTGLFTDLGIELAQFVIKRKAVERLALRRSLLLKWMIIVFFFAGCITGGFAFRYVQLKALYIAVAVLLFTLWYDRLLFRYYSFKRKIFVKKTEV
ncbi:MAG: DUF1275 domain-containing protein [Citrobacter freundii]|nr:MAG: DUF1275 domain-containing protein [Citrobacter freundii]